MTLVIVGAAGMLLGILLAWIVAWIALRDRPGRPSHAWEITVYRSEQTSATASAQPERAIPHRDGGRDGAGPTNNQ